MLFIIGYLLFKLTNIEGFRDRPINKYYIDSKKINSDTISNCEPNKSSKNCNLTLEGGLCQNSCAKFWKGGAGRAPGDTAWNCNNYEIGKIVVQPKCAKNPHQQIDCCKWNNFIKGCGNDKKLNVSTNASTTKGSKYTQYIIDFDRNPPISPSCRLSNNDPTVYDAKTQYVIFIKPDIPVPKGGFPFIMYFEFIDKDGCLESYGENIGYGGMIHDTPLIDSYSGKHFNVLQNMQKVYENCIDNGIGLVIVPEYIYDVRSYMNCSGLGFNYPPGSTNCDNNLCWNDGNNPDMFLINQILFNIKYWNNPNASAINPCKWSPNNNYNNSSYTMKVFGNMKNINFNLSNIGIMGYSVSAHFVSRLIKEWQNLEIWKLIVESHSRLSMAILISGGSYNCYRINANKAYVNKKNEDITDDELYCFPNKTDTKLNASYSTDNCPNSIPNNKCFIDGLDGYNYSNDYNTCGDDCDCGKPVTSGRGCCPFTGNTEYDGDAPDSGHPPTILLDTQCDAWSDPNATIYYKNAYKDNPNIILLPSTIQSDAVHGLVDNQVDNLNKLINFWILRIGELHIINQGIKYPTKLGPLPPPVPWGCLNVGGRGRCIQSTGGQYKTHADCTIACI